MFILTSNLLWMRAEMSARIFDSQAAHVSCIVKRIEPSRGMGFEFTEVPEDSRQPLEELFWKLEGE